MTEKIREANGAENHFALSMRFLRLGKKNRAGIEAVLRAYCWLPD
jgi:hypothetical protein